MRVNFKSEGAQVFVIVCGCSAKEEAGGVGGKGAIMGVGGNS